MNSYSEFSLHQPEFYRELAPKRNYESHLHEGPRKEHDEVGTNNPAESMSNVEHRVSHILMDLNV